MKLFTNILAIVVFMALSAKSIAQPLMETVNDVYELKEKEHLFRDKPLGVLLKEIGPEVKRVLVESKGSHNALSYIVFWFADLETLKKSKEMGKKPIGITVMIKEHIEWIKPEEDRFAWSKQDAANLACLTVAYIRVSGESLPK